jgi:EGF domain
MRFVALATTILLACSFDSGGVGGGESTGTGSESGSTGAGTTTVVDADASSGAHSESDEGPNHGSDGASEGAPTSDSGASPSCEPDNGGCDPLATCSIDGDAIVCTCPSDLDGDGIHCVQPGALASPLRVAIECLEISGLHVCVSGDDAEQLVMLTGAPAGLYTVTLQVRGVVELKSYDGGVPEGVWNPGGEPVADAWAVATLDISAPEQHIRLNNGTSPGLELTAIDVTHDVVVASDAAVRLSLVTIDGGMVNNADHVIADGVPPAPEWFDGQFLQVDVLAIAPLVGR